jgi:AcrR family transcriptional regulator
MSIKTTARPSARDRILAAANELFYEEGIHSVGIDRVIERAGVAKASLYNTFGSKDELVRSYLLSRQAAREARISRKLAGVDTPKARLLAIFDVLADVIAEPDFRGCAFQRASAEAPAGGSVQGVCDSSRGWTRALMVDLASQAGVPDPDQLAQQLLLLYDGALAGARLDRDPSTAVAARTLAESLIDAAIAHGRLGSIPG